MPPVPLEFTDIPVSKKSRRSLNFGQPLRCERNQLTEQNTHGLTTSQKEDNGVGNGRCCSKILESAKHSFDFVDMAPRAKRKRFQFFTSTPKQVTMATSPLSKIIDAVEKLSTESQLVADGSRENILPTITGKHSDLSAISPETMCDVMDGVYGDKMDKVTIIDCRYPYEYYGGHIKGALNLFTKEAIQQFLQDSLTSSPKNHVLIFHCEFSSERGPKMYRFLRSLDRDLNKDHYPRLNFPEIYLLEGGYKAFFYSCKENCFPQTYMSMLHKDHKDDLRHFRVKSKSWSLGDRPRKASITGSGLRLRF